MDETRQSASLTHFKYIDALRGIAFLGVLLVHCQGQVPGFHGANLAHAGRWGVQLFFLLSAVTLFRSLSVRGRKEEHPICNYFIRRFFRIAPLFWFAILFYWWLNRDVRPGQVIQAFTFSFGWTLTGIYGVVPGSWSIAAEMTFYLCLPFLFRHVASFWTALTAFVAALAAGGLLTTLMDGWLTRTTPPDQQTLIPDFLIFWFPAELSVFLLGATLYHALHDPRVTGFLAAHPSRPAVLVGASCYGGFALAYASDTGSWLPLHVLYSLTFCLLITGLSVRPFALFVNPVTCTLGTISFSCYLTHFAVLPVVGALLRPAWFAALPHHGLEVQFLVRVICALILTVVCSTVTYWLIERPGVYLGKWLIRRGGRTALPVQA